MRRQTEGVHTFKIPEKRQILAVKFCSNSTNVRNKLRLGNMTPSQLPFLWESNLNFLWETPQMGQQKLYKLQNGPRQEADTNLRVAHWQGNARKPTSKGLSIKINWVIWFQATTSDLGNLAIKNKHSSPALWSLKSMHHRVLYLRHQVLVDILYTLAQSLVKVYVGCLSCFSPLCTVQVTLLQSDLNQIHHHGNNAQSGLSHPCFNSWLSPGSSYAHSNSSSTYPQDHHMPTLTDPS